MPGLPALPKALKEKRTKISTAMNLLVINLLPSNDHVHRARDETLAFVDKPSSPAPVQRMFGQFYHVKTKSSSAPRRWAVLRQNLVTIDIVDFLQLSATL